MHDTVYMIKSHGVQCWRCKALTMLGPRRKQNSRKKLVSDGGRP